MAGRMPRERFVLRNAIPDKANCREAGRRRSRREDFRAELERIAEGTETAPAANMSQLGEGGPGHARIFTVEVRVGTRCRKPREKARRRKRLRTKPPKKRVESC